MLGQNPPLSATRKNLYTPTINLYAPKNSWADFLIFVVPDTEEHVFIIPRSKITKPTTATLESKWLAKYADNWDAVIARDPAYESRSAVIDDPAVQAEVVPAKVRHKEKRQPEVVQAKVRRKEKRQKSSRKRDELMKLPPTILPKYALEEELDYLVQRANTMFKRP
jgi:hypothetical protein